MKKFICLLLACAMICSLCVSVSADAVSAVFLYVSESGDDSAVGSANAPFKTVAAAVKAAENIDGTVVINLRGGVYQMTETVEMTEKASDIVIRSYPGERATITGGAVLPYSAFKKCADEAFLDALSVKSAKDKIVCVDLNELGISDFGEIKTNGYGLSSGYSPTLSYNDISLTIARYPNEGYLYTDRIIEDGTGGETFIEGIAASRISFTTTDNRYKNWSWDDVWNVGYFKVDWAETTIPAKYDEKTGAVVTGTHAQVTPALENRRVMFFNVPEELDIPGEWYLNRKTGMLYMIPPQDIKPNDELVFNSYYKQFFNLNGSKNIKFIGVTFSGTCSKAVYVEKCEDVVFDDCEFTGIGDAAVYFKHSLRCGVKNSYFHDLGSWGIYFKENGDRTTLTSGECFAINCHIERFSQYRRTYSPGVHIDFDVGTLVSNCEIHDAPHFAIRYEGNDIVIEYNDFYDVCQDTADTGAVYTGRRWDTRGNEVRYNYFHDLTKVETTTGMQKMAVYLDDLHSSTRVHGNVFYNVDSVALMGGGRYNHFTNNIMVDCQKPLVFDDRGLSWNDGWLNPENSYSLYKLLEAFPYKEGIWNEKYPELAGIFEDDPKCPKHNVLKNNVFYRTPEFEIAGAVKEYGTVENNIELTKTAEFADYRNKDFALKEDSEIFTKLPEFEAIPFKKMGRYEYVTEDEYVEKLTETPSEENTDDAIKVMLNGKKIDFADVEPQIINDRTMVPLRAIFEALGATVEWDDKTKTVTAVKGDVTVRMTIGADSFMKNDDKVALDSPATIVDSRTLVPVRAIAESFGCAVGWDGSTGKGIVTITD